MTIPVMVVVALFVFLLLRLSPGDPAAVIAGDYATAEDVQKIREKLGLSEPIFVQFVTWLGSLIQGDLGTSIFSNKPVTELIAQRLEPTLMLALTTIIFSILVAVPLGTIAAFRAGSWDRQTGDAVFCWRIFGTRFCIGLYPHILLLDYLANIARSGLSLSF